MQMLTLVQFAHTHEGCMRDSTAGGYGCKPQERDEAGPDEVHFWAERPSYSCASVYEIPDGACADHIRRTTGRQIVLLL